MEYIQQILAKLKQYPIATVGIIIALVSGLFINLRQGAISVQEARVAELDKTLTDIQRNEKYAIDLDAHTVRAEAYVKDLEERLMDEEQRALNYQYFYEVESASSINMQSLRQEAVTLTPKKWPPSSPTTPYFYPVNYKIQSFGSFDKLVDFLYQIETGRYFARIDKLTLAADTRAGDRQLSLSLVMDILGTQEDEKIRASSLPAGSTHVIPQKRRLELLDAASAILDAKIEGFADQVAALRDPYFGAPEVVAVAKAAPSIVKDATTQAPAIVIDRPKILSDDIVLQLANRQLEPTGGIETSTGGSIATKSGKLDKGLKFFISHSGRNYQVQLVDVTTQDYTLRTGQTTKTFRYEEISSGTSRIETAP